MIATDINKLADEVRETAFSVHCYFKNGFLEKVYENALVNRLNKSGIQVQQQYPIKVNDEDGSIVGEYIADLLIEESLVVEIKAIKTLSDEHYAQILAYLKATNINHGMLINFGSPKIQFKKFIL